MKVQYGMRAVLPMMVLAKCSKRPPGLLANFAHKIRVPLFGGLVVTRIGRAR